jgi:PAS domain-containing protein
MRQAASYVAMPIFVVDPGGDLVYFNEPAEELLGLRYEEVGEMPAGGVVDDFRADRRARRPDTRRVGSPGLGGTGSGLTASFYRHIRALTRSCGGDRQVSLTAAWPRCGTVRGVPSGGRGEALSTRGVRSEVRRW